MGLWATLLVWEFTSGEFLGLRRDSISPHGSEDLPDPAIESGSPALQADSLPTEL